MLSVSDNELLTRTGAGTPMGALFRRFWHPVLLTEELPEADGPPRRLRVLGEDLVAFRDSQGQVGIVDAYCPHRRAPMFFGRNEACGLRCVYHGWKFDVQGNCVEMPTESPTSNFKDKVQIKAYPTAEYGGCVWIYMGPPDRQPALPHLEWAMVPDSHRVVSRWLQECNYMQAVEGEIDSAHVSWLHAPLQAANSPFRGRFNDAILTDGAPQLTVKPTDYGFCYGARRQAADNQYYWRVTQWLLPTYSLIPAKIFPRGGRAWIPIDDTHISVIQYSYHPERPLTEAEIEAQKSRPEIAPARYRLPDGVVIDICRDVRNLDNDYLIDRHMQRTENYTGISVIRTQDTAMTEGMGGIVDRSQEHLGTTDAAVIAARRRLITMARDLQRGIEPSAALQPEIYNVRAVDMVCPEGDFLRFMELYAEEAVGMER
jgi:phenylpropionate dioxygenase-like ring-hydroxylating dioxygenase large terminal subunit